MTWLLVVTPSSILQPHERFCTIGCKEKIKAAKGKGIKEGESTSHLDLIAKNILTTQIQGQVSQLTEFITHVFWG